MSLPFSFMPVLVIIVQRMNTFILVPVMSKLSLLFLISTQVIRVQLVLTDSLLVPPKWQCEFSNLAVLP